MRARNFLQRNQWQDHTNVEPWSHGVRVGGCGNSTQFGFMWGFFPMTIDYIYGYWLFLWCVLCFAVCEKNIFPIVQTYLIFFLTSLTSLHHSSQTDCFLFCLICFLLRVWKWRRISEFPQIFRFHWCPSQYWDRLLFSQSREILAWLWW